jgi:hypothetical protein
MQARIQFVSWLWLWVDGIGLHNGDWREITHDPAVLNIPQSGEGDSVQPSSEFRTRSFPTGLEDNLFFKQARPETGAPIFMGPSEEWASKYPMQHSDDLLRCAAHHTMNAHRVLAGCVALFAAINLLAAEPPALDPHLEPLRPFLEKTWKAEFKNSTPEKPSFDVARWERALNGKCVRVLQSVNDGAYGGESIVRWDEAKKAVTFHYFTTAGFTTVGTMTFKDGGITTHEVVQGAASGITEVRAETKPHTDGTFTVKSEYLKDGAWTPGREATYREDSTAKVVFK